ncbi:MAG: hypothetical protein HY868_27520 [Chloroflexi bacterium]|nr:hypothetical protein [Chloroflexota bacterium]
MLSFSFRSTRLSRALFVRLSWVLFVLTLVACANNPFAPTLAVKGGDGEFRVVLFTEPVSLNPNLRSDDGAFSVAQNVYNKLLTLDADYRVIPDLAETWEVSADGLTYTFHLAKNARWHDGKSLTSADVKWTFEALRQSQASGGEAANRILAIETPDAQTVVMRLKQVWSPFIPTLAWYGTFVLPSHVFAGGDWTKNPANDKPIGTGPFKFVEWVKGDHITLAANRDYFKRGPYLDQVTYRVLKDSSTAGDLIARGEADYTLARPAFETIRVLQNAPAVIVKTFLHPARFYAGFNFRRKPFDDLRVRQAVSMALDRPMIVDRAVLGYGIPGEGFYTPAIPWAFDPEARVPDGDIAAAEKLLDQAGLARHANGTRAQWTLLAFNASPFKEIALAMQTDLQRVGIELEPVLLATTDWNARVFTEKNFDLALTNGSQGPDPDNLNYRFGSKSGYQFMGYANPELDAALDEGARLTKLEDRARAYFRAQEILARDLVFLPIMENVQFIIYRADVTGLPQVQARGLVTFQDYSLVRLKK